MRKLILVGFVLVSVSLSSFAMAQNMVTTQGQEIIVSGKCNWVSLDPKVVDPVRQQCLQERYFGGVIQGLFGSSVSSIGGGLGYIKTFKSSDAIYENSAESFDNLIRHAWDFAEKMVEKRNLELAEEDEEK